MYQGRPLIPSGIIPVPPNPDNSLGGATPTGPAASGAPIAFGPGIIPLSSPALLFRPTAGLFNWNDQAGGTSYYPTYAPVPEPPATIQPLQDIYGRDQDGCTWRFMEPSPGVYDFSWLEARAAAAHALGGRFGFRIMTSGSGGSGPNVTFGNDVMPHWIQNDKGTYGGSGSGSGYIPDSNNANYLNRLVLLWEAIGARFGNDPRFGMMDIGMYGPAGEWWTGSGYTPPTLANGKIIVDAHTDNMPNCDWVALPGDNNVTAITEYCMNKVLSSGKRIGIRGDSWAASQWYTTLHNDYWNNSPGSTQWQRALIVAEPANIYPYGTWQSGDPNVFSTGLAQVSDSHISMIGNGNIAGGFNGYNSQQQQAWVDSGKTAGPRIQLLNLTLPRQIESGSHATLTANWQNVGVAPPLQSWPVKYHLRTPAGQLVWTGGSTRDFKLMLPGSSVTNENFNFPDGLPTGPMNLSVQVVDPTNYFPPLALANAGRAADGSYPLGQITLA